MAQELNRESKNKSTVDALSAVAVVAMLFMMLIPLPSWLLSFLLVLNLALSVTVLLMTTYVKDILEFSVFPTMLLGLTLFRIALNVSSTKLILLQGDAGSVIQAFGEVVVKGNAVVGFIVFLILIIVQFIVITKGAERVSEVAARFTLDAMPGKQMGVDAELNAGIINEQQARERREAIQKEADFYGAMDGASKFIRGEAIASIFIVAVNIVGGIAVGFLQRKMGWMDIIRTYTILSIGDGLVHQVPALIVSTATGILVTRSASKSSLGSELIKQFSINPKVLKLSSATLFAMGGIGIFTGLPVMPFMAVSALLFGFSGFLVKHKKENEDVPVKQNKTEIETPKGPEDVMPLLHVETLELELGYGLLFLVDPTQGGDLLERVGMIRRQCAKEIGIVIPPIRIRDNGNLSTNSYSIKIRGMNVAKGELMPKQFLAMSTGYEDKNLQGIATTEPTFGLPAIWIKENQRRDAEVSGYTVVDNASVIATHLTEILKSHAHELLGRQEVQALLNDLKTRGYTAILEELIPSMMNIGSIQKVLQNLLIERVPIRNLLTILECLGDTAPLTKDTDVLTEYVRSALGKQISGQFTDKQNSIACFTLSPEIEKNIFESIHRTERGGKLNLEPNFAKKLTDLVVQKLTAADFIGERPLLICNSTIRPYLKRHLERTIPNISILGYSEISPDVKVRSLGTLGVPEIMAQLGAA